MQSNNDPVMTVHFGARNPDEFLQYMRIDNDAHLYLMSRFIGEAWLSAFDGVCHDDTRAVFALILSLTVLIGGAQAHTAGSTGLLWSPCMDRPSAMC